MNKKLDKRLASLFLRIDRKKEINFKKKGKFAHVHIPTIPPTREIGGKINKKDSEIKFFVLESTLLTDMLC